VNDILTTDHARWGEFIDALSETMSSPGDCNHQDHRRAEAILTKMGADVDGTIAFLESRGGFCDCEILLNVDELPF
jgi:Protein of unknown function (DUF2695)